MFSCGSPPEPPPLQSPLVLETPIEEISYDLERFIPARMAEVSVPGLSIAIVRDAEIVWTRGFGICKSISCFDVGSFK